MILSCTRAANAEKVDFVSDRYPAVSIKSIERNFAVQIDKLMSFIIKEEIDKASHFDRFVLMLSNGLMGL